MKCPKCGYTSFDHLTACRKCEHDLTEFRTRYGLGGRFQAALEKEAGIEAENPGVTDEPTLAAPMESMEISAAEATDFGFDFLNEDDENLSTGSTAEKLMSDHPREKEDSMSAEELQSSIESAEFDIETSKIHFEEGFEDDEEEDFAGLFLSSLDGSDNAVRKSLQEEPDSAPKFTTSPEKFTRLPLGEPETDSLEEENGLMEEGPVTEEVSPLHAEAMEFSGSFLPAAPLLRRMGAGIADLLILSAGFGLFLLAGQLVQTQHGEDLIPSAEKLAQLAVPYFLVLFGLFFGYFTVFHFLTGQTPGKMLFRVRVESSDGEHISFSQAFLRSVGGLFSLLIAGIGFLLILLNSQRRGLNDLLAGSRVIFLGRDLEPGSGDPAGGMR